MKIAIAQPTYLPWLGYFDLLDQVDQFVLLDSVQFEKQSWQQRNRIKTPSGLQWLTVPVVFRGKLEQRIADVEIRDPDFWRNHLRAIELNYRRAPYFERYFERVRDLICAASEQRNLCRLTMALIGWVAEELGITTPTIRSSEMMVSGKRTHMLAEICRSLGATQYLSPLGSAEYLLSEQEILTAHGVEVTFQHYEHPEYRQLFPPFQAYACVLDVFMNEGPEAVRIIRGGRRPAFLPGEAALQIRERVGL